MISVLHLLWIVPLCTTLGFLVSALLSAGSGYDWEYYDHTTSGLLEED